MKLNQGVNAIDQITNWNGYSECFQSVMPSEMTMVNKAVAQYMHGHVADFGCGAGKIIPFIMRCDSVKHYTGVDSSSHMIARARWMADQFDGGRVTLIESWIEATELRDIDSALSINSYYIWPDPMKTLNHIFRQLKPGAIFVLATINSRLDMPALLNAATPEMIAHPHWNTFKQHNLRICSSADINLVGLDELIGQVRAVGFKVLNAHDDWYLGGLSTLVLERSSAHIG